MKKLSESTNLVLGGGRGDIGDGDLEVAVVVGRASLGSRGVRLDLVGDTLGESDNSGREGEGGGNSVAHIGGGLR